MSDILGVIRRFRTPLAVLALLQVLAAAVTLALPWLAGRLFGQAVSGAVAASSPTPVLLGVTLVAATAIAMLIAIRSARLDADLLAALQSRVFAHVQSLPLSFHEERGKGDVLTLVMIETARLARFVNGTLVATPARVLMAIGATFAMFRIDPRLALIVPLLLPFFAILTKVVGRSLRGLALAHQQAEARAFELVEEGLEMLPATKAFTREARQQGHVEDANRKVSRLRFREGRIQALIDPVIALLAAAAALAALVVAGRGLGRGELTTAEFVSFMLYALLLARPVAALARIYGETQVARGALERLRSVYDVTPEASGSQRIQQRARGAIRFDGVHFGFPRRGLLFTGLDLDIAAGDRVALVGENGVGKTALINLLMRFYVADRGRILLDGVDCASLGLGALRSQIGLVPQITHLFNGTIAENIGFGADDPPRAAIERSATLAQAADFITRLPDGYDTLIGDRGIRLSGGQRQRLALARALVKDPPILILDEATAMFDAEGEEAFVADCADALEGRTVILITHRPALLAFATRQVAIAGGRAIELGPEDRRRARA